MQAFLSGGGAAGELIRAVDWSATPLGPTATWPASLKTLIGTILHSRHPMFIWWGPELIQFYNDAYIPSFGEGKHPAAMGQRGRECWREIWPIIGPQIDDVMSRGVPSWNEDHLVPIHRNGKIEEVFWTYGYSPVFAESGAIGGTLVVCTETTARVVSARRQRAARAVLNHLTRATERAAVVPLLLESLSECASDVRFALVYRVASGRAERVASVGLDDAALRAIDPDARAHAARVATHAGRSDGPFDPFASLFAATTDATPRAERDVVVFGLNPRLAFDDDYRDFLADLAEQAGHARARIEGIQAISKAESERNNLLGKAPVAAALLVGHYHVYALANARYCQVVGRDASALLGLTYREAFPELVGTALPGILDRVYQTGESYVSDEMLVPLVRHSDGKLEDCFFKFNLEAIRDADERVSGMMVIAIDLTEQVVSRRLLERAGKAKDEFLAMLGHELRNPIGAIAAAVRMLETSGDDADRAQPLDVLRRQVGTVTRLLDDLLDVARLTHGRIALRTERRDLCDLARRAVDTVRPLLDERNHTLALALPVERVWVQADPTRIEQVLVNLLTNAAKYTPEWGRVALSLACEGADAVVHVTDAGAGIAPEVLPHIFELFVQSERTIDRAEGGLGIGLTLVRGLVGLHGGTVSAHSAGLGAGSEFVVRLPLAESPGTSLLPDAPAAPRESAALKVLVVDDNEDIAEMMTQMLEASGHTVTAVHDGLAAVAAATRDLPDTVLLDLGLPGIDGLEVARRLRADERLRGVLLIALSGYGQREDKERTREAGFDHHLVKPVNFDQLMKFLDERAQSLRGASAG